jgi:hypothetical protein
MVAHAELSTRCSFLSIVVLGKTLDSSDIPGRAPALHYGPNEFDPSEETDLMRQASAESAGRRAALERSA